MNTFTRRHLIALSAATALFAKIGRDPVRPVFLLHPQ